MLVNELNSEYSNQPQCIIGGTWPAGISHIGEPKKPELYGSEPKIQVNDVFVNVDDIILFVNQEKDKLSEAERDQITMSMKVDIDAKMGLVSDVQQELREANARKLLYSSIQRIDR